MNRNDRPIVMSPDGPEAGVPPSPGITDSPLTTRSNSSSVRDMEKTADFEFKEPSEESYFDTLTNHFNVTPLGLSGGYVVHIPLSMGKIAQSGVKNNLPPKKEKPKYIEDDEHEPVNVKNLSDEEIEEEEETQKEATETISQIGALPSGDITLAKLPSKRLDAGAPDRTLFPAQGKTRVFPKSTVMSHIKKTEYDTEHKTTVPWDNFKKVVASQKVVKLAQALNVPVQNYTQQNPFENPNTPAVVLDVLMLGQFNTDWLGWEPETLRSVLSGLNVHVYNLEKIQALQVMHSNNLFWDDESVFEKVSLALNNITPNFGVRQDLNIAQMSKAVAISEQLKKQPFGDEVTKHVALKAHMEGLVVLPLILSFAQDMLNSVQPGVVGLVPQIQQAYLAKWPSSDSQDTLSVQLRKLYAIDEFLSL
jgi:hypothetical protein